MGFSFMIYMLRCQAQIELFYILAGLVTVLHFGAFSDCSTFTLIDAHATDLTTGFFGGVVVVKGGLS